MSYYCLSTLPRKRDEQRCGTIDSWEAANNFVGWPEICKEEDQKVDDKDALKRRTSNKVLEVIQSVRIFIFHVNSLQRGLEITLDGPQIQNYFHNVICNSHNLSCV